MTPPGERRTLAGMGEAVRTVRGWGLVLVIALMAAFAFAAAAPDRAPAARTTLDGSLKFQGPLGTFRDLVPAPGERRVLRQDGLGKAKSGRKARRRSMAYFAHLTDPQIADEASPLRVEKTDPVGGSFTAAWRPQEALGTHVLDQIARSVNRNAKSPIKTSRGRAALGFSVLTGDLADNQQFNEVGWYVDVLSGNRVTPYSGAPVSASNPCPGATPQQEAALNAKVAAKAYVGVQDYESYPGRTQQRYWGFWDPDTAPGNGPYEKFPRYPGLMDRAQAGFQAEGLAAPWYASRGNHDGLIQGNVADTLPTFGSIGSGCSKFFPSNQFDPSTVDPDTGAAIFADPNLFTGSELVPSDPDRRLVSEVEYKQMHKGADRSHGFGYVNRKQDQAADGYASYYSYAPAKGFRFIALDTVAEGGGASGNIDNPQYEWLEQELDRWTPTQYVDGKLDRDDDPNKLIVLYGHHTLGTMDNTTPDEAAGPCGPNPLAGCDGDPRDSEPIHQGLEGAEPLDELLKSFPNVILAVTGHTHHNRVSAHRTESGQGFWELNTASHVDFPQQSRLVEVMNNRDGTLSILGTLADHAAPVEPPEPGPASGFSSRQLASLSRILAANDPQSKSVTEGGGRGKAKDRNVELIIRDPRKLAR
jgi:metallophosphoesterase (TIGR03767 family)